MISIHDTELLKLIRDNIPEIIRENGQTAKFRISEGEELIALALKKLVEESKEAAMAANIDELAMELADVLEIWESVVKYTGLSKEKIDQIKNDKKLKNGGFEKRLVLVKKASQ